MRINSEHVLKPRNMKIEERQKLAIVISSNHDNTTMITRTTILFQD